MSNGLSTNKQKGAVSGSLDMGQKSTNDEVAGTPVSENCKQINVYVVSCLTLLSAHCTLHSTLCSALCTLHSALNKVSSCLTLHSALHSTLCTLHTALCTCTLHVCTLHSDTVLCTLHSGFTLCQQAIAFKQRKRGSRQPLLTAGNAGSS